MPGLLELLAGRGAPGREIAVRLDLARSLGPGAALRRLRGDNALPRLHAGRDGVYREIWSDAAAALDAEAVELEAGFLELRRAAASTRVRHEWTELDDLVTISLSEERSLVHRLLRDAGLSVPEHVEASVSSIEPGVELMRRHGSCVVKPASGTSVGTGITAGVSSREDLFRAALRAARSNPRLLVERHVAGDAYRFLLLDGELLDVVRRGPPTLVGDGRSTIAQLTAAENARRVSRSGHDGFWQLRLDLDAVLALRAAGLRPASVPAAGERVRVKTVTNQNRVEDNETVRGEVSPELIAETAAAARLVGLRLAGVDVVTPDLTRPLADAGGAILEVNCTPGLHHHYHVLDRASATRVAVPILRTLLDDQRGR